MKAAFGLPISIRGGGELNFKKDQDYNRRASPIYISVVKNIYNKKFYWVVVHLQGDFMPHGSSIDITGKYRKTFKKENSALIDDFILEINDILSS